MFSFKLTIDKSAIVFTKDGKDEAIPVSGDIPTGVQEQFEFCMEKLRAAGLVDGAPAYLDAGSPAV